MVETAYKAITSVEEMYLRCGCRLLWSVLFGHVGEGGEALLLLPSSCQVPFPLVSLCPEYEENDMRFKDCLKCASLSQPQHFYENVSNIKIEYM